MKLGISSFTFCWAVGVPGQIPARPMTLTDLIEATRSYGLSLLQIGDNLPLDALDMAQREEARQLLQRYGIELEVGARGLTHERLETYLEIARFFGSRLLRIVIDIGEYQPSEEEIIDILRAWAPKYEHEGVRIALENHDRLEARQFARIVRMTDSPWVGICLDTANSLGALEGTDTAGRELIDYTFSLHAKDVSICRLPSQLGFVVSGMPAGEGAIDLPWLIEGVRHNGMNANCILEQWVPFEDTIDNTVKKERAWADASVANLRDLVSPKCQPRVRFGASAAYTISKYGPHFTVRDICDSMRDLAREGFTGYQPELSFASALDEWENGGLAMVNACQSETNIETRQLICHFVLDFFISERIALSDQGYGHMARFIALAGALDNCQQILLPVGPIAMEPGPITLERMQRLRSSYLNKICDFTRMAQRAGLRVSFELLPGNFIGSYHTLFQVMGEQGLKDFGVNFDTGHAIAGGEDIYVLARDYAHKMMLTHLGDPERPGGVKMAPGRGMVDWPRLMEIMSSGGYDMALDLEIMCAPEEANEAYRSGKTYLTQAILACRRPSNAT